MSRPKLDLRVLSILQPWAWLIVNGYKDIENRVWTTRYRGRFLVHAGKRWGTEQRSDLLNVRWRFPHIPLPDHFDLGGIVGEASIIACVSAHESPWFNGPYGFVLADARPRSFLPLKGSLGFFSVSAQEGAR